MQSDREAERMNAMNEARMGDGLRLLSEDLSQGLEDGLSARMLLSSIRRHLAMVLAFTLLLCIAGALVGLGLPYWLKAEGVLVIHSRPQRMADLQELPDPSPDPNIIQSEVDILQSRSVIEPVVRSLRLWRRLNFRKRNILKDGIGKLSRSVSARYGRTYGGFRVARKVAPRSSPW
jgi:uncharacterized protein involved in exopolysaccharide biosynthesis